MPAGFTRQRRYYAFSRFLRERFGAKVYRVTIDAGFTCPNVDGSVAVGGCVYCDNRSFSPNRRLPRTTVREQVRRGIEILQKRYQADKFLAYFQAATNTYATAFTGAFDSYGTASSPATNNYRFIRVVASANVP